MEQGYLKEISVRQIIFGKRKREDYGDIDQLAVDIEKVGLIHPITVADLTELKHSDHMDTIYDTKGGQYLLLAGGRRLTAWRKGELGETIPAYVFPKLLDADEIREIELMENISRKELGYQEKALLTAEFHDLQQKIHGKAVKSSKNGHSMQDTAELLDKSKSTVQQELEIAAALKAIPELAKITNKTEMLKTIRQMRKNHDADKKATSLRKLREEKGDSGLLMDVSHSFVVGDFFEKAKALPNHMFDFIEIDPPYAIDLGDSKKSKHVTADYNEIDKKDYPTFLDNTLTQAKRLLKPKGWLIMWYGISEWHDYTKAKLIEHGFKVAQIPCLWIKTSGQTNRPQHIMANCYESFWYCRVSEDASLSAQGTPNYMIHPGVPDSKRWHPTQRPMSLMTEIYTRFIGNKSAKILVPFAGSGVSIRTAYKMGYFSVGYDLSKTYKDEHDAYVLDKQKIEDLEI